MKSETNQLKPEDVATVQDILRRTGRKPGDLVHYAMLKLAPHFQALPENIRRALADSGSRDLWRVPDNVAKAIKSVKRRKTTEIQKEVKQLLASAEANPAATPRVQSGTVSRRRSLNGRGEGGAPVHLAPGAPEQVGGRQRGACQTMEPPRSNP